MMTATEFNNVLKQINDAFGGLDERIKAIEERLDKLEKPAPSRRATKKVEEKA